MELEQAAHPARYGDDSIHPIADQDILAPISVVVPDCDTRLQTGRLMVGGDGTKLDGDKVGGLRKVVPEDSMPYGIAHLAILALTAHDKQIDIAIACHIRRPRNGGG